MADYTSQDLLHSASASGASRWQCRGHECPQFVLRFQLALPNSQNVPASNFQRLNVSGISFLRPAPLFFPEFRMGFWFNLPQFAFMGVPEASMYKDRSSILWQDNIRLSRKVFSMEPIPIAK